MVARLSRIVPLLIVLAVIAGIVYLVAAWRYSPNRAKEILIRLFTWITGILTGFFALASIYALLDGNAVVFELTGTFLGAAFVALAVTRLCHAVFVHHHPKYKKKPVKTKPVDKRPRCPFTPPWKR